MKLLVVEDEVRAAEYLVKGLSESGFSVDVANDGLGCRPQGSASEPATENAARAGAWSRPCIA